MFHWLNAYWGLVASIAAAAFALIMKGTELLDACVRLYRRFRGIPEVPASVSPEAFGVDLNARYGFRFAFPKTWDRSDPTNSDGSSYSHPKYPSVRISAWGEIPIEYLTDGRCTSDAPYAAGARRGRAPASIISVPSGRYETFNVQGKLVRDRIPGARSVFDTEENGKKYRVMSLSVESVHGVRVHVCCGSPKHLYKSFEPVFVYVCDSLELFPGAQFG
jgi:hypothetical protein